jgi:hypothetical protein
MARPTVLVDAENVRRSVWPNMTADELLARCRAWAAGLNADLVVVFDGRIPDGLLGEVVVDERCTVVGTGSGSADDWIAEAASRTRRYWLVTSDRELRRRAGGAAERTIGGGSFARQLGS